MPDRIIGVSGNSEHPRLRTRVKGFDRLLDGGLLAGDAYLVSGGPGTGKTTLGNQLAFQHAAAGDNAVIFMLQTEPHEWMLAHLGGFDFVRPELINKRMHYVSLLRQFEHDGLTGVLQSIQAAVRDHDASLIVLDGAGLVEASGESEPGYGRFVRDLQARAAMLNCTCVILAAQSAQPTLAPHVDGLIELSIDPADGRDTRSMRIAKQRGARHLHGSHQFVIDRRGVTVFPRLEAVAGNAKPHSNGFDRNVSTGIPGLDQMLGGGLKCGTTTAVFGMPGTGKTLLDLQFLGAGSLEGETGLHISFHESAELLSETSDRLGLPASDGLRTGQIQVRWEPAVERSPDGWAWSVLEAVDEIRPARVSIDTFSDVARMFPVPTRHSNFGMALSNELRRRGITSMINLELDPQSTGATGSSIPSVLPMFDSAIQMRLAAVDSSMHRMISVVKHRQSWFDSTIREFSVNYGGIDVGDRFDPATHFLPNVGMEAD